MSNFKHSEIIIQEEHRWKISLLLTISKNHIQNFNFEVWRQTKTSSVRDVKLFYRAEMQNIQKIINFLAAKIQKLKKNFVIINEASRISGMIN